MDSVARRIVSLGRRGLLRGATAAAALAAITPSGGTQVLAQPAFTDDPFSQGVASGDPWPDSVVLWTRLAPPVTTGRRLPNRPIACGWEVAEDDRFTRILRQGTAIAHPELGHALHVTVDGLAPGRRYAYRFHAGGVASPVGHTRTAPAPDATPDQLRFAVAGCQHWEHGFFTAWDDIAQDAALDFVFHYGDYIYEYAARAAPPAIRPHLGDETYTLTEYRDRYALYRSDSALRRAHAAHPFLMSFDDHEVDNNWAGAWSEEDGSRAHPVAVPPEVFALRKQIAFQAWYEAMPVRQTMRPNGPSITAWRGLRWGRLADIAVLDTRSHRDDQPCGDGTRPPCPDLDDPSRRMLGANQESWLRERLVRPDSIWKLVAQQVPMMRRDLGTGGPVLSMDKWDGYPAARARLLGALHQGKVRNLAVLAGDIHQSWAGALHLDPRDPTSPVVGHEFVATSITSGGDGSDVPSNGARLLARNPHVAWIGNRRGYNLHQVTARGMTVTSRMVERVSVPGAPMRDAARFVVEADNPRLHREPV